MIKKYEGYFLEDGSFAVNGGILKLPSNRWAVVHILEDEADASEDETMTISTITFEVEKELYHAAEQVFKKIGMDMTCAVNLFLQAVVREGRIPFEISDDIKPQKENGEQADV